jgi:hypothetical protein
METVEQLTANFKAEGYANPAMHAECKHSADVIFDVQIKNKRRFVSPAKHNASKKVKTYLNKGGTIHYLQPKRTRKVYVQVAIPASTQAGIRPHHKLTPEQAFAFDVAKMMH